MHRIVIGYRIVDFEEDIIMAATKKTVTKPAAAKEAAKPVVEEKETKKTVAADLKEDVMAETAAAPEKASAPRKDAAVK